MMILLKTIRALCVVICIRFLSSDAGPISDISNDDVDNVVPKEKTETELCLTPGCVKWAAAVLEKIDSSVNPCDNFYKFACGNFIETTIIPDAKTEVDQFSIVRDKLQLQLRVSFEEPIKDDEFELFRKVKSFYKDCMDTDQIEKLGLEVVKSKIEENGGWPVLRNETWEEEVFNWMELIDKFNKYGYNASPLIAVTIEPDLKYSSRRIIYIDVAKFGLGKEYLKKGGEDKIVKAYYNFMVDVTTAFGGERETVRQEMQDVLDFEILLANHTLSNEERRNLSKIYNNITIEQLQARYPTISWLEYVNNVLPKDVQINSQEIVIVTEPLYLQHLEEALQNTPKKILANYLIWHTVIISTDSLTKEIQNIKLKLQEVVYGIKAIPSRWETCVQYVKPLMANIVGALYVRKYFSAKSKSEIQSVIKYIQKEFEKILESNDWMDDETKEIALQKLKAMNYHVAYPEELFDDDVLTKTYGKIKLLPGEFLNSALSINKFNLDLNNRRLREPVNKTEWITHGDTATVNAFFNQVENALRLPAGILQGQFFDLERPRYMNFGAFGFIVGHEITHGFDDVGRQFDSNGNLKEWWREGTKTAFLKKVNCFIEQYENYNVSGLHIKINGKRTQGENIADNGGAKEAYFAYQTWREENAPERLLPGLNHTQNQMFWISLAQNWCHKTTLENLRVQLNRDIHPPHKYRVMGPLSNMKEFSRDFNCPSHSAMNPDHKCKVW